MPQTPHERELEPLGLSFPIPSELAFRLDIRDREALVLILAGISALYTSYGVGLPIGNTVGTSPTASTSDAVALAANASRKFAVITNRGASDVYLAFGVAAEVGKGIYLKAAGGSLVIDRNNLFLGAVHCIATSGTSALSVAEAA